MPITIEHGGAAGPGAGQIIAQAGQANLAREQQNMMQLRQLAQQRDMQQRQIQSQSQMQMQAADTAMQRTAFNAGLQKEMQEEAFANSLQQMQEQARVEAEQWEYRFTAQDRQEIQKDNNAIRAVQQAADIDEDVKAAMIRQIQFHTAGITGSQIPADPNKPKFIQGQEPGTLWPGKDGGLYTTIIGSSGVPEAKLILREDQTSEYMREQAEISNRSAELERQQKTEDEQRQTRADIAKMTVESKGRDGAVTKRSLNAAEREDILRFINQVDKQEDNWFRRAKEQGLPVLEMDKDLPSDVGYAQAYMRGLKQKYGKRGQNVLDLINSLPLEEKDAALSAYNILMNTQQSGG